MSVGTLLVIGARKKSIGQMVAKMWSDMYDGDVVTAGISGDEQEALVAEDGEETRRVLEKVKPDRVLVTIGKNEGWDDSGLEFTEWMDDHFHTNVTLPMGILTDWLSLEPPAGAHFVALSSNSAHIPRSQSMAYCSSKAALSMAIRCAARDVGKAGMDMSIYGWEPGLVKGTPMSGERGGTRMLGLPEGMPRRALANQIVNALAFGGPEYNGVLVRLDAGEV
jgi:hypothetical protein